MVIYPIKVESSGSNRIRITSRITLNSQGHRLHQMLRLRIHGED